MDLELNSTEAFMRECNLQCAKAASTVLTKYAERHEGVFLICQGFTSDVSDTRFKCQKQ